MVAAKAISTFARQHDVLEYKGGIMDGEPLDPDQFKAIARLPGLDVLHGQLVGVAASPLTGLTRGLASMISGLAVALGQIAEQGPGRRGGAGRRGGGGGAGAPRRRQPRRGGRAEEPGGRARSRPKSRGGGAPRLRSDGTAESAGGTKPERSRRLRGFASETTRPERRNRQWQPKVSTEDWIEELKGISVLELSERIKALEEEFGVSATAVAAAAPAAGRRRGRWRSRGGVEPPSTSSSPLPATRRSR